MLSWQNQQRAHLLTHLHPNNVIMYRVRTQTQQHAPCLTTQNLTPLTTVIESLYNHPAKQGTFRRRPFKIGKTPPSLQTRTPTASRQRPQALMERIGGPERSYRYTPRVQARSETALLTGAGLKRPSGQSIKMPHIYATTSRSISRHNMATAISRITVAHRLINLPEQWSICLNATTVLANGRPLPKRTPSIYCKTRLDCFARPSL